METVILVAIIILLIYLFSPSKNNNSENNNHNHEKIKKSEQKAYKALASCPNQNQEDLIDAMFNLVEGKAVWRISFLNNVATIYDEKNEVTNVIPYAKLGYGNLDLHKHMTSHTVDLGYAEFPWRLKLASERKGYLFWPEYGHAVCLGNSYTSHDGGHSYTRDIDAGDFTKSVNVCSKEYYMKYKPYPNPNDPPLKKL